MSAPSQTGGQPTIHTFVNQTPVVSSTAPSLGQAAIVSNHVSIDLSAASDTGASSSDHVTADNTPDITGHTDVPFSHVIIYEGHQKVGSGFSDVNGNYTITVSSLGDGVHTLTASATTLSSSQASTSSPLSLNIDTSLAKPSIDLQASTDSGVSDHDDLTKHHNPIFTGHTDANAQIEIIDSHGKVLAHGSADSHGDYQLTVTSIPEGRQNLSVIATDLAGNTSRSDLSLEVDYTAPTITNVNLSDVSTHQVLFAGKVSPDTHQVNIVVKQGSHVVETLHAALDGHGGYSVHATNLPDGDYTAFIQATDNAGNRTSVGYTGRFDRFSVDTVAAPLSIALTHDTGVTGDHITSDGSLTITGQEQNALIEYSIDGGQTWQSSFTPQAGINHLQVRQTDSGGNVSVSTDLSFTLDNQASAPLVALTQDTGDSSSDRVTKLGGVSVTGTEPGASVEYSIDQGQHWNAQFMPVEGMNTVQVRQTDISGNVSPATTFSFRQDTQTDIRVNSVVVDSHGHGMEVQIYLPKDAEVTHLEITSDGGGSPLIVDLKAVNTLHQGASSRHPDHQYIQFKGIDLSSLPEGNLNIHAFSTDLAGNTATTQTLGSYAPLVLDRTASATDDSNTVVEDVTTSISGNVLANDPDANTVATTGDIQGHYGVFHLSSDGSYTYTLNNALSAVQQLNSGSTPLVDTITYIAQDTAHNQASAHLAISIQGTDDNQAPVVTGHHITSDEDTTRVIRTTELGYRDGDNDELNHITITQLPAHGLLLLNGAVVTANQQVSKADLDAGHLTFTPINNQHGSNYAHFNFTANDGHQDSATASIVFNVNSVNDTPTVGSTFKSLLEDNPYTFKPADLKFSDVDGDSLHHITITNVAHGRLSLHGRVVSVGDDVAASDISSLVYTPAQNYHSSGASGLGGVQFTANDGHTDSKEGSFIINIVAVPDPATFNGDSTGGAQEDLHTQASGVLNAVDPDGTQGFIAVQGGVGIVGSKGYGHAHIDSNGHWTYNLYNNHPVVQQLKQGQTDTETITVQAKDGTTHDIVITVTGTNDIPTVSEKVLPGQSLGKHVVTEDGNLTSTGQLTTHDTDGDTLSLSLDPSHGASYGSVQLDSHSNTWTYHLDNANSHVNALNDGDVLHDTFTVLVDDGHGGKTSQQVTMTINGHTDPVPYTPPTISVSVDAQHARHVTPTITATTVRDYAHRIGHSATTASGHHEINGHGSSDIIIVQGRLREEAELKSGNDILYIGGSLTDKEIEGGSGSDTLILGAYNRQNAPRLRDHGEKLSDGHEEMEIESIENIILAMALC
ncbi:probable RTX [Vibrio maritimus]|uniref:Probable RTX n=1 Tax=Vibrio maritimus TaxID=990268 RepID=A0A090SV26_9VIBR|nr:probable RTX [Vibrio maritimus]